MFDVEKFKKNVERTKKLSFSDLQDDSLLDALYKERLDIIIKDQETFDEFIDYMLTDMEAMDYVCLSEISDEISQLMPSKEFISAYRNLALKYPEETKKYHIDDFIEVAEGFVEAKLNGIN